MVVVDVDVVDGVGDILSSSSVRDMIVVAMASTIAHDKGKNVPDKHPLRRDTTAPCPILALPRDDMTGPSATREPEIANSLTVVVESGFEVSAKHVNCSGPCKCSGCLKLR